MAGRGGAHEAASERRLAPARAQRLEHALGERRADAAAREALRHLGGGQHEAAGLNAVICERAFAIAPHLEALPLGPLDDRCVHSAHSFSPVPRLNRSRPPEVPPALRGGAAIRASGGGCRGSERKGGGCFRACRNVVTAADPKQPPTRRSTRRAKSRPEMAFIRRFPA